MVTKNRTTREDRAAAILAAGLVTLHFDGTASVKGSGKAEYTVTRDTCTCPDFTKRGIDCKHRIATRSLCKLYRAFRAQAKETGRARLPYLLGLALRGGTTPSTPKTGAVPCHKCGQPAPAKLGECSDCYFFGTVAA